MPDNFDEVNHLLDVAYMAIVKAQAALNACRYGERDAEDSAIDLLKAQVALNRAIGIFLSICG